MQQSPQINNNSSGGLQVSEGQESSVWVEANASWCLQVRHLTPKAIGSDCGFTEAFPGVNACSRSLSFLSHNQNAGELHRTPSASTPAPRPPLPASR